MGDPSEKSARPTPDWQPRSDVPFYTGMSAIGGLYLLMVVGMLMALSLHTNAETILQSLQSENIQYSIKLSLLTCTMTTILSLWVAVPIGYLMSRHQFFGKSLVDAVLDIPIVLPPLVVGLCLLILFNTPLFNAVETVLHSLEHLSSNFLVPLAWLGGFLLLDVIAFVLLKNRLPRRMLRLAVLSLLTVAAFVVVSRDYLHPVMPAWVPVPKEFTLDRVEFRDQSPLRESRSVYSGRYTFTGTAEELAAAIESRAKSAGFARVQILGTPDSLTRRGRRRYLIPFFASDKEKIPFDGEIILTAKSRKRLKELRREEIDLATDPIAWIITIDELRLPDQSRDNIVPTLTIPVTFEIPAVILAQFMVACAFAVRTMRVAFDQIHPRYEDVALTLGCSRSQAFWLVVLPQSRRGMLAAATLAWARSLGEFGPILIFAGSTRMKTEVLSTTVFLEMNVNNIGGAVAASLIMIFSAIVVLVIARVFGLKRTAF